MPSNKPLNPNAEPFYPQQQKQPFPAPVAYGGFQYYGYNFHPYSPYYPGFGLYQPNHVVNQEALSQNVNLEREQRRGSSKKNKRYFKKKKVKIERRVKKWKGKMKKLPGIGSVARRAMIPFPTTAKEAKVTRTTTVMIRNVPNQLTLDDLLKVLDNHCFELNKEADPSDFSKFDFVYLPMDFRKDALRKRKSNLGYAFVNFTTPAAAFKFYKRFNGFQWDVVQNRKTCEVTAAQYQGTMTLVRIFSAKKFTCKSRDFLPLRFFSARTGFNRRTKGVPVGNHIWAKPKNKIGS